MSICRNFSNIIYAHLKNRYHLDHDNFCTKNMVYHMLEIHSKHKKQQQTEGKGGPTLGFVTMTPNALKVSYKSFSSTSCKEY